MQARGQDRGPAEETMDLSRAWFSTWDDRALSRSHLPLLRRDALPPASSPFVTSNTTNLFGSLIFPEASNQEQEKNRNGELNWRRKFAVSDYGRIRGDVGHQAGDATPAYRAVEARERPRNRTNSVSREVRPVCTISHDDEWDLIKATGPSMRHETIALMFYQH